jgi:CheY-like chemotaxis protein
MPTMDLKSEASRTERMLRPSVLVVEDEALIGLMLEEMLDLLGYRMVGPAATTDEAIRLAHAARIDLAILDINLGRDGDSRSVAEMLKCRGIPFAFVTGYERSTWKDAFTEVTLMRKPFSAPQLGQLLAELQRADGRRI